MARDAVLHPPCNRVTVLHEAMNVTLKLPDELCKAARHRAIDESKSLSAWVAVQLERILAEPAPDRKKRLIDLIGQNDIPEEHQGKELPLEDRKMLRARAFSFEE